MQTPDVVAGLHNFWEFSQPPECLDEIITNIENVLQSNGSDSLNL